MNNPESDSKLDAKLNSALNLMRRMPPSSTENSLAGLLELAPDLTDELLTHVDQPLKIAKDTKENKDFVLCDYNRDGDSYRSPWSNQYFPPMDDGFKPGENLRKLEIAANKLFNVYRKLYFTGGCSSAYFFETDEDTNEKQGKGGFGACFLVNKKLEKKKNVEAAAWDSIHVFEVIQKDELKYTYKLTTTVMISMILADDNIGKADLSGLRTQQNEQTTTLKSSEPSVHVKNMGQMLEDCETRIRNEIEKIYIQKTRTVINGMRGGNQKREAQWGDIAKSLKQAQFHKDK